MTEPFDALTKLADLDNELVRLDRSRASLPSRVATQQLDERIASLDRERAVIEEERRPLTESLAKLEEEVEALSSRAAQIDARLAQATGAGRDLAAMDAERAQLRRHAEQLEDEELSLMEQLEPIEARHHALEDALGPIMAERAELARSLDLEDQELDAELEARRGERAALATAIDADLLARYERISASVGGAGAARLIDGHCDGCHLSLPSVEVDNLRRQAIDQVSTCEQCGRILLRREQLDS